MEQFLDCLRKYFSFATVIYILKNPKYFSCSLSSISKKSNASECSNYHIVTLISRANRKCSKSFNLGLQQYVNRELPDVQAGFRKGRGTRYQIANICLIIRKQENSRKTSASLTTLKSLTVWITTKCRKFLETKIPDHLTCLLRNMYAGPEPTIRTGHGTLDWFKIRKGVRQGCT